MEKETVAKRVFYLEAALKKAWKEFKRLQKAIDPTSGLNKPFTELKDE